MIDLRHAKTIELSNMLDLTIKALDLTPAQYAAGMERYRAVVDWLTAPSGPLAHFNPDVYLQGSWVLGIVIRPWNDNEEFDIDMVIQLLLSSGQVSQAELKKLVGDRLRDNANYARMLAPEKRRCWRIDYAEQTRFHLDVLPAIPDAATRALYAADSRLASSAATAISITCKDAEGYFERDVAWPHSNPRGFAMWFKATMRHHLISAFNGRYDDLALAELKTPLQRSVQAYKRHRDVMFGDDPEQLKPISIIITTLAGLSYQQEDDLYSAVVGILDRMLTHVHRRADGTWLIQNPVDPRENFADRWNSDHRLAESFFRWHRKASEDFKSLLNVSGVHALASTAGSFLGKAAVAGAVREQASASRVSVASGERRSTAGTLLQAGTNAVRPHTHFGE